MRLSDATLADVTPFARGFAMSQPVLVCPTFRSVPSPATQWAHDIRNTLATAGLHLDALERLIGSPGRRAVEAAHALMLRATAMCEQALAQGARAEPSVRRNGVDVMTTIRQVADLLEPIAPEPFEIRVHADGPFPVVADAGQIFRVLFNLLHNAVTVARRDNSIKLVDISVARAAATVVVRVADDGPGLPATVRKRLFRPNASSSGGSGIGLAIARELAERNGGMLELARSAKGTTFVLELPAAPAAMSCEGQVTRSLGPRAA
jgi:signal transduction histidine kinase